MIHIAQNGKLIPSIVKYWSSFFMILCLMSCSHTEKSSATMIRSFEFIRDNYKLSKDIQAKLDSSTMPWRFDEAATDFSFNGNYTQACNTFGQRGLKPNINSLPQHGEFVDAGQYIIDLAPNYSLLIFNEAHHFPLHRLFVKGLLKSLFALGYKNLFLEDLTGNVSKINDLKQPVITAGFYIKEPQYGDLVREATNIGFRVIAYDEKMQKDNDEQREQRAFHKVDSVLKQHPNQKSIILCGYDHAREDRVPDQGYYLAGLLKKVSSIKMLAIDQMTLSEAWGAEMINQTAAQLLRHQKSTVCQRLHSAFNRSLNKSGVFDLHIFYPKTVYHQGRPLTLYQHKRKFYLNNRVKLSFPCLLLAYPMLENMSTTVPCDIIELEDQNSKKPLLVPRGSFRIVAYDGHACQDLGIIN